MTHSFESGVLERGNISNMQRPTPVYTQQRSNPAAVSRLQISCLFLHVDLDEKSLFLLVRYSTQSE